MQAAGTGLAEKRSVVKTMTEPFREKLTEAFNRQNAVHLVIDLQDFYCDPKHAFNKGRQYEERAHRALRAANDTAAFIRKNRQSLGHIWAAHDCASSYGYPPFYASIHMQDLARQSFHKKLPVNDNDPVICKQKFSAFAGTNLHELLQDNRIGSLLLSGAFLEVCVYHTAVDAAANGYNIYVIDDLVVPSSSAPDAHRTSLEKLLKDTGATAVSSSCVSQILKKRTGVSAAVPR